MEKGDVDTERLIQEVYKYRSLWDQKSSDYLNSMLKLKDWSLVALEMDCSVDEAKSQWKTLKDTFLREIKNTAKSGQDSCWRYFDCMSFLLQSYNKLLLPRGYSPQSFAEFTSPAISCGNEFSENSSVVCSEENQESSQRKKVKSNPKVRAEVLNSTPYQSNFPIQFNLPRPEENNEDYFFLLSLLPSFERMSAQQKMNLKIKIMQDVYNASYGESMPSLCSNSSSGIGTCSSDLTFDS